MNNEPCGCPCEGWTSTPLQLPLRNITRGKMHTCVRCHVPEFLSKLRRCECGCEGWIGHDTPTNEYRTLQHITGGAMHACQKTQVVGRPGTHIPDWETYVQGDLEFVGPRKTTLKHTPSENTSLLIDLCIDGNDVKQAAIFTKCTCCTDWRLKDVAYPFKVEHVRALYENGRSLYQDHVRHGSHVHAKYCGEKDVVTVPTMTCVTPSSPRRREEHARRMKLIKDVPYDVPRHEKMFTIMDIIQDDEQMEPIEALKLVKTDMALKLNTNILQTKRKRTRTQRYEPPGPNLCKYEVEYLSLSESEDDDVSEYEI